MEMGYRNTFITVAPDSPVKAAVVPQPRGTGKPIHLLEYELLSEAPYQYTEEELQFKVHVLRQQISDEELDAHREKLWREFFSKSRACMRSSALPKKYGWGLHYNEEGKIALYPMESAEYAAFAENRAGNLKVIPAMRTKRS